MIAIANVDFGFPTQGGSHLPPCRFGFALSDRRKTCSNWGVLGHFKRRGRALARRRTPPAERQSSAGLPGAAAFAGQLGVARLAFSMQNFLPFLLLCFMNSLRERLKIKFGWWQIVIKFQMTQMITFPCNMEQMPIINAASF